MEHHDPLMEAIKWGEAAIWGTPEEAELFQRELEERFLVTCAVLVLDSTGFTRTVQQHGVVRFLSIIQRMREIAHDTLTKWGATEFRAEADNVYAHFETVDSAVQGALELHKIFDDLQIPLTGPDDLYGLCAGIGWGRLLKSGREGVFGDEMNLASKLGEDTAKRGETLLTPSALSEFGLPLKTQCRTLSLSGVTTAYYAIL